MKRLVLALLLMTPVAGVATIQELDPLPPCLPCTPTDGGTDQAVPTPIPVPEAR